MRKTNASTDHKQMWSTDDIMKTTYRLFLRDMRRGLGDTTFLASNELALGISTSAFRETQVDLVSLTTPYRYKAKAQAAGLFKRYIAADDKFSEKELDRFGRDKFNQIQLHAALAMQRPMTYRAHLVLQRARRIVKDILGKYDREEHEKLCYFGKRSVLGTKYKDSYLDVKVDNLTGSPEHIAWFREAVSRDKHLLDACDLTSLKPVGHLELQTVPKSWKISRTMLANTCIGNYYTGGLGKLIVKRLDLNVYKLNKRPEVHGLLAHKFSKTRSHATADLTSASDLYTSCLVKRLVPYDWYKALDLGRLKDIKSGKSSSKLVSFMTMGIGYTFPLQSLLFYSILEAIRQFTGLTGTISAFGDDLIYPSKMHTYVSQIFGDIGFILNEDKTFIKEQFRESCGNDFYFGNNVRPFQPKGQAALLSGHDYLAFLYKTINGWLRRWSKEEIPLVYDFLIREVLLHSEKVHQVPPDFPDYSGVKVDFPITSRNTMFYGIRYNKNLSFSIDTIGVSRHLRRVPVQSIYLWNDLRIRDSIDTLDAYKKQDILRDYIDNNQLAWKPCRRVASPKNGAAAFDARGKRLRQILPFCNWTHFSMSPIRLIPYVTDKGLGLQFVSTVATTHRWHQSTR